MNNFTKERWVDIVYNLARFEDVEITKAQAYELLVLGTSYNEIEGCSFHDSMVLKNIFRLTTLFLSMVILVLT